VSRRQDFNRMLQDADQGFSAPGIDVLRSGKMIALRNVMSREQRREFADAMNDWRKGLPAEMAAIEAEILRFEPMDVLAYGLLRYAVANPETYKEYEHGSVAMVEHIATLYAKHAPRTTFEQLDGGTMQGVFETLDRVTMYWPFAHEPFDLDVDRPELFSLRARILMSETLVRMPTYVHQIEATTVDLFAPFSAWLRAHVGFDASEAIQITRAITKLQNDRLNAALHESAELPRALLEALRGRVEPPHELGETFAQLRTLSADAQIAYLSDVGFRIAIKAIGAHVPFTVQHIVEATGLSSSTVEAFVEVFQLRFGDVAADYVIPTPAYPMKTKPLLRLADNRLFAPSLMLLEPALQFALEKAMNPSRSSIADADRATWDAYVAHRAEYAEDHALRALSAVLQNASMYQGLKYRHNNKDGELDGLLLFDRYALFVEVKAGTFSPQARGGDIVALVADVQKLIRHPHEQGERALTFVHEAASPTFRLKDGAKLRFDKSRFTHFLLITVTLEQLGQVTGALSELPRDPQRTETPWGVNLHDLEVIVEHVGGPAEFLQYVRRRVASNRQGGMVGYDELDWLGRYIYDSLEFEEVSKTAGSFSRASMMSHTTDLDAYYLWRVGVRQTETAKPLHRVEAQIARIIDKMRDIGTLGWTDVAAILLDLPTRVRKALDRKLQGAVEDQKPFVFESSTCDQRLIILMEGASSAKRLKRADAVVTLAVDGLPLKCEWSNGTTVEFTSS